MQGPSGIGKTTTITLTIKDSFKNSNRPVYYFDISDPNELGSLMANQPSLGCINRSSTKLNNWLKILSPECPKSERERLGICLMLLRDAALKIRWLGLLPPVLMFDNVNKLVARNVTHNLPTLHLLMLLDFQTEMADKSLLTVLIVNEGNIRGEFFKDSTASRMVVVDKISIERAI